MLNTKSFLGFGTGLKNAEGGILLAAVLWPKPQTEVAFKTEATFKKKVASVGVVTFFSTVTFFLKVTFFLTVTFFLKVTFQKKVPHFKSENSLCNRENYSLNRRKKDLFN